jgi:signal transduction histidine kinase
VRSFVACPVLVGQNLWGVLNFAAAVGYEYSDLEIYSLRALANLTGVALDAMESADTVAGETFDVGRLMQASLSNELVVATRHEIYNQLTVVANAHEALVEVVSPLKDDPKRGTRLTKAEVNELLQAADHLDEAYIEMVKIANTIKLSQSELALKHDRVIVIDAWNDALHPFGYRRRQLNVDRVVAEVSQSIAIVGSEEWLRIAFMQLILNTLDAFARNYQKGRKEFGLRVQTIGGAEHRLRYYDNAGGVIPGTLTKLGIPVEGDPGKLVFDRYVTSKETGTGLGLASCRAALAAIDGSIAVVDWRGGMTFDIDLPAWRDA